ncbi:cadherin domain-containing protein [Rhodopirellula europaea]|uniref:beta strand repeat-containing protein n=1 Tax=Rhodopirellula europaea TaxID=1263866 RepID=UPI003D2C349D
MTIDGVDDNDPVADLSGDVSGNEGDTLNFDASGSFDDDGDTLSYAFTVTGPGGFNIATPSASSTAITFEDDGVYTVQVEVSDGSGTTDTDTINVNVANVKPTIELTGLTAGGPVNDGDSINEGETFVLNLGDITDPGADTVVSYIVKWGDGSPSESGSYTVGGTNLASHTYTDNSLLVGPIVVDLIDEDGVHFTAGTFTIGVDNVAPTITSLSRTAGVDAGDTFTFIAAATDPATINDPLLYTWDFGDGSPSVTTMVPTVSHEYLTGGDFDLELTVDDQEGGTDTETLEVFVNSLIGGIVDSDTETDNAVSEDAGIPTYVGLTASASDTDPGDTITYSLSDNADGRFVIDSESGEVSLASSAINAEMTGSYEIEVTATSSDSSSSSATFMVTVLDDNTEFVVGPVTDVDAADNEVAENSAADVAVGVTASAGDDDVTDTVSYSLSDDAGGRFKIDATTGVVTTTGAAIDAEMAASYVIEVTATSTDTTTSTETFTINVLDDNTEFALGPVTDVDGDDNEIIESSSVPATVGITALATDADAGDTITYSLTDDFSGLFSIDPSTGVISLATAGVLDAETTPSYSLEVTATSSDTSTSSATFTVNVLDDNTEFVVSPVTDVDAADNEVAENSAADVAVGVTASASDDDVTDMVSYSLSDDAGGRFKIDATTGVVTTTGAAIDAEMAASYDIEVTATSTDGSPSTESFTIDVLDVNEFGIGPVTDINGDDNEIDENATGTVGITAFAEDDDATDGVTYTLGAGFDNAEFSVDSATGVVSATSGLDYDLGATRTIEVTATSDDGSFETAQFTISVNDVSESAVGPVTDGDAADNEVAEGLSAGATVGVTATAADPDTGVDTVTYSLSTNPSGLFAIDANTGVVTTTGPLDAESVSTYIIEVTALSTDGSTSSEDFSIEVLDVDDNDVGSITDIDPLPNVIPETIAGTGSPAYITAFAEDVDLTNNGITYSLASGTLDNDEFVIDGVTGVVTAGPGAPFDAEAKDSYEIEVTATSDDGSFSVETFAITIFDFDDNDVGPLTDSDDATADSIDENAAIGTYVGITGIATDLDGSDSVSYSLAAGGDNGLFDVDSVTGEVTTAAILNAEDATTRTIGLVATSTDGSVSSESFVVSINDVDEFDISVVEDTDVSVNEVDENQVGATVGVTASASDDDVSDSVTYSLQAGVASNNLFDIDLLSGVVTTAVALDFETTSTHSIVVTATSDDGSTSSETFNISVLNVADSPVGPVGDNNAAANITAEDAVVGAEVGITALAVDPDGDVVSYSLSDDAGGLFAIDSSTGVVTVAGTLDFETAASHAIEVTATSTDIVTSTSTATFTIIVTDVDEIAPEAGGVKISAQAWAPSFLGAVDSDGIGYSIADGEILSWINLNTITVEFDEPVDVESSDLSLTGFTGTSTSATAIDFTATFGVSSFSYDAGEMTATWVLGDTFASLPGVADYVLISLNGVTDVAGNMLAPLAVDEFNVNPGDIDQNGVVDFTDLGKLYPSKIGVNPTAADETARADIDGNGVVDFTDLGLFYPNRIGVQIPVVPNSPSAALIPDSLLSLLAVDGDDDDDDNAGVDEVFSDSNGLSDLLS